MNAIDELFSILTGTGNDQWYDGDECVSQLSHALQCAALAESEGAPASLVTAALLHDIGHLIDLGARAAIDRGIDARHESRGVRYLQQYFDAAVLEPIGLHVAAKRYLVAIEPRYLALLSEDSIRSLNAQGGAMDGDECALFAAQPYAEHAVRLRRWDDLAKAPTATTPEIEHFRPYLAQCLRTEAA